jgi:hypothetical protein
MSEDAIEIQEADIKNFDSQKEPEITIVDRDILDSDLMLQLKRPGTEIRLNNGLHINLGLPRIESNNIFFPPHSPYVFEADITMVREGRIGGAVDKAIDREALGTIESKTFEGDKHGKFLNLGKCVIIYAHGISRGGGSEWYFEDGQNIPDVTLAYNEFAEEHKLPKIELVASCNADPNEVDLQTNKPLLQSNDIRVGAFGEERGIAYAVGELGYGSGRVDPNRGIIFTYEVQREDIFNIDYLIAKREFQI